MPTLDGNVRSWGVMLLSLGRLASQTDNVMPIACFVEQAVLIIMSSRKIYIEIQVYMWHFSRFRVRTHKCFVREKGQRRWPSTPTCRTREGNVFTGVCDSIYKGVGWGFWLPVERTCTSYSYSDSYPPPPPAAPYLWPIPPTYDLYPPVPTSDPYSPIPNLWPVPQPLTKASQEWSERYATPTPPPPKLGLV